MSNPSLQDPEYSKRQYKSCSRQAKRDTELKTEGQANGGSGAVRMGEGLEERNTKAGRERERTNRLTN